VPEISYTLLRLLPKNTLSRAVGAACRLNAPRPVIRAVIRAFVQKYGVDVSEAERTIDDYPTFTDFFTRRLKPGSRPIAAGELLPVSPVDGTIGELGDIVESKLLQAKGKHYTVAEAHLPGEVLVNLPTVPLSAVAICCDLEHHVFYAAHTEPEVAEALRDSHWFELAEWSTSGPGAGRALG